MNEYHILINELKRLFMDVPEVNTITLDDGTEIDLNKKNIYPLVNLLVTSAQVDSNQIRFTVSIDVVDVRDENITPEADELSQSVEDSLQVLNQAVRELLNTEIGDPQTEATLLALKSKVEAIYTAKFQGNDNKEDNLTQTLAILNKVIKVISLSDILTVTLPIQATPATLRMANLLDGWTASTTISVDNVNTSKC